MQPGFARSVLMMLAGPIVWAVHFLFVYGMTGVICARQPWQREWWGVALSSWTVMGAGVLAMAALGWAWLRVRARPPQSGDPRFMRWLAGTLILLALLAIGWETLPLLLVPHCA